MLVWKARNKAWQQLHLGFGRRLRNANADAGKRREGHCLQVRHEDQTCRPRMAASASNCVEVGTQKKNEVPTTMLGF